MRRNVMILVVVASAAISLGGAPAEEDGDVLRGGLYQRLSRLPRAGWIREKSPVKAMQNESSNVTYRRMGELPIVGLNVDDATNNTLQNGPSNSLHQISLGGEPDEEDGDAPRGGIYQRLSRLPRAGWILEKSPVKAMQNESSNVTYRNMGELPIVELNVDDATNNTLQNGPSNSLHQISLGGEPDEEDGDAPRGGIYQRLSRLPRAGWILEKSPVKAMQNESSNVTYRNMGELPIVELNVDDATNNTLQNGPSNSLHRRIGELLTVEWNLENTTSNALQNESSNSTNRRKGKLSKAGQRVVMNKTSSSRIGDTGVEETHHRRIRHIPNEEKLYPWYVSLRPATIIAPEKAHFPTEEGATVVKETQDRGHPTPPDLASPTLLISSSDIGQQSTEEGNIKMEETHHRKTTRFFRSRKRYLLHNHLKPNEVIPASEKEGFPHEDNLEETPRRWKKNTRLFLHDTPITALINPSLVNQEASLKGDIKGTHHSKSKHTVVTRKRSHQFPEEGDNFDIVEIRRRKRRPRRPHLPDTPVPINPSLNDREFPPEEDNSLIKETHHSQSKHIVITEQQPHVPNTAVPTFINPLLEGRELPPEGDNFDIVEIRGRRRPSQPHVPDAAVPTLVNPSLDDRELPPEGDNPVIRETHHSQSKHIVITEQQPPQFPEEGDNFDLDVIGSRRRPSQPHVPETAVPTFISPSLEGRKLPPEGDNSVIRETHHSQSKHIVITEQQPPQFPEEGDNFDLDVIGSQRRPSQPHVPDTAVPTFINPSLEGRELPPEEENFDIVEIRGRRRPSRPHLPDIPVPTLVNPSLDDRERSPEGDNPVIRETHHSQSKHIVITEQQPPQFPEEGDNFDLDVIGSRRRPSQPHVPETAVPTFISPSLEGRKLPPEGDNSVIRETHHSQSKHIT
ncbi:hypothetical protein Q1695_015819 [Nippostrongylus brasiliensis]|nr:hypothetical protein Q1695_015819 [Nippostrongylus brasiliensis]